jgi:hypothetical protein
MYELPPPDVVGTIAVVLVIVTLVLGLMGTGLVCLAIHGGL